MNELGTVKQDFKSYWLEMLDKRNKMYYNSKKPPQRYDKPQAFTINPKWKRCKT